MRLMLRVWPVLMLFCTTGCLATPAVWNDAGALHLRPELFRGFVVADDHHPNGLLVEYVPDTTHGCAGRPHHVVFIPLDGQGQPSPPYSTNEDGPTWRQEEALSAREFTRADFALGDQLAAAGVASMTNPIDHTEWRGGDQQGNFNSGCIVLNLYPPGTYDRRNLFRVALPSNVKRPADELFAARARAVLFTPPAVLFDLTAGPFVAVGGYLWWAVIHGDMP